MKREVTEHLTPPRESQNTAEQFSAMFDSLDMLVYVSDMDTHEMLFLNPYGVRLFGAQWHGRRCFEVLQTGQDGPCNFCTNHRLVRDGAPAGPFTWEFQNTVTGRWFLCVDQAIRWSDGRLVRMEAAADITARKELEQFREQSLGLVAHDLRNPLNVLTLRAHALHHLMEGRHAGQELALADAILKSADQIRRMVDDLVESARWEAAHFVLHRLPVDLVDLSCDVASRLGSDVEQGRIRIEADADLPVLSLDPSRIERALVNLLANALKYSSPGSPVRLLIRNRADSVLISVVDQGIGIGSEDLPRIFNRFARARNSSGLGLGLYVTRLIAEAHGGRVWVESLPGKGSTFHLCLPKAPGEPVDSPAS